MSWPGRVLLILGIVFLACVITVVTYAKVRGFSARATPSSIEAFLAEQLTELSYPSSAKSMKNPLQPSPENLTRGRDRFANDCAVCHGNGGTGRTETGEGLYPKPPNLRDESDLSDGEIFYIIRNGVRFTGMPAWNSRDDEIWKLVLFIRHLPQQTPDEVQAMQARNHVEAK